MLYQIAHAVVSFFAKVFFRLEVVGVEHVPKEGGAILSANHSSYFDIPLLGCALPRPVDNIAKSELFKNRLIGSFLKKLGGFPIRRGKADRMAIQEAVKRLKSGHLLSYYPEGTRTKDGGLQKGKSGIGMIVREAGVNVVPVYIRGTYQIRPFRKVTIQFGLPIDFQQEIAEATREKMHPKILYGRISVKIMTEIASLEKQFVGDDLPKKTVQGTGRF